MEFYAGLNCLTKLVVATELDRRGWLKDELLLWMNVLVKIFICFPSSARKMVFKFYVFMAVLCIFWLFHSYLV
jgi:hypothetical protein